MFKGDRSVKDVLILSLVAFLMLISIVNTAFLAHANKVIARQKIEIEQAKYSVYMHLNTIAWDSTVSRNKLHVTGITRVYKCDSVKKEIENHIK